MKSRADLSGPAYSRADFVTWALALARSGGRRTEALRILESEGASDRLQRVMKAAVASGTTASLSELTDTTIVSAGFIDALRNASAFERMFSATARIPMDRPGAVTVTADALAYVVTETGAKPVTGLSITGSTLARRKAAVIVALSRDLARYVVPAARALLDRALIAAVAATVDADFLAGIAADAPTAAASGTGPAALRADVAAALDAMAPGAASRLFLVMPAGAYHRMTVAGTTTGAPAFPGAAVGNVTPIPSDSLPTTGSPAAPSALLIDASGIAADADAPTLDVAGEAAVELDDAPGGGSPTLVSLWQTNRVGVLAERNFGYLKLRANAVQEITDANW